ncbi:MAG: hypothetical protein HZB16_18950 [Armatimonadetes bacterium]|nr:hypothetical protein [Armatimonadota bacterium]
MNRTWAVALALTVATLPMGKAATMRDTLSDTWVATDALGRSLPTSPAECRPARADRFVGMFYFLWLGNHSKDLHDLTQILAANPDKPDLGPVNAFHHWGQPQFGYYFSGDEWVLAKHAKMLSAAGVDTVVFDITNAFTYDETLLTLCRVWTELRARGQATPQIAFIAHSSSAQTVTRIYDNFFAKNLYPELWFRWKGKPLMLWDGGEVRPEIAAFFSFRRSWAWSGKDGWFGDGKDAWTWLDNYPQKAGWHEDPKKPEALSVCVAQHPISNIGRSFHDGKEPPAAEQRPELGLCFAEQCRRALEVDPEFVFVTGWNEWVAQRFLNKGGMSMAGRQLAEGDSFFVDTYSQEYSRDIEPMRGGHGDNYYYQLVDFVRRYKGVRPRPVAGAPTAIASLADWAAVTPEYLAETGGPAVRDAEGFGGRRYANSSLRNTIERAKLARDGERLYAYAQCAAPITTPDSDRWMSLLLNTDADTRTGWHGFDILVNRRQPAAGTATVERFVDGQWREIGAAQLTVAGNELMLAVPRALLGLGARFTVDFKWTDNAGLPERLEDWLEQGCTAPSGRFCYRYAVE